MSREQELPVPWWKDAVFYEIYLRSFYDADGDGLGDLEGVIHRLDYLAELGITALWLTPFCVSPDDDNGYDISDYRKVDPRFGDLDTFDRLLAGCHRRGIKVVMDMVLNFTSDRHPWFVESRSSPDSPRRDYYFWRPANDGHEPNNWSAGFSPSAWELDSATGEYFLHYYSPRMPDLNWENTDVRRELHELMRWWLERGVDGLRLDSINLIKKDTDFPDAVTPDPAAPGYFYDVDLIYNQPGLLGLLQEMRREVFAPYGAMAIGETSVTTADTAFDFVDPTQQALDMVFNFEPVELDRLDLSALKEINRRWYRIVERGGWICHYLSNHDQPRQVSKFGDDGVHRIASAKALAMLLHTLPGTPFVYQGEEIGMTNFAFESIEDYDDIAAHNRYRGLLDAGSSPSQALDVIRRVSRDNARTPMQWTSDVSAGFTSATPWLPVNPNHSTINVDAARSDPDSIFHFYRRLIALRKTNPVLTRGNFVEHLLDHRSLYVYSRTWADVHWLVVLNLSGEPVVEELPQTQGTSVKLCNKGAPKIQGHQIELQPWQCVILAD